MESLNLLDWLVLSTYFVFLFGIAVWVIRKKQKSAEDYFLAGKEVGWFVVGTSLFASNIGSEHLVGLAGTGLLFGAAVVTFIGLSKVGGWDNLYASAGSENFNLWEPSSHPDYPWTGIIF